MDGAKEQLMGIADLPFGWSQSICSTRHSFLISVYPSPPALSLLSCIAVPSFRRAAFGAR